MNIIEEFQDVLQNLEFAVAEVWRAHPEMSDYTALSGYQAVFQFYRAEFRGQTPRPPSLQGLDAEVFDHLKSICEWRLGRGPAPGAPAEAEKLKPIPLDKLLDCLRELTRSVERHTKASGRQGYLTFIDQFLP
jgi:hypothetical protein